MPYADMYRELAGAGTAAGNADPYESWLQEQYGQYTQARNDQGIEARKSALIPGYALLNGQGPLDPITNYGKALAGNFEDTSFKTWRAKNEAKLKEAYKAKAAQDAEAKNRAKVDSYFQGQLDRMDGYRNNPSSDPYYQQMTTAASNRAGNYAALHGIRGGLSQNGMNQAYNQAGAGVALQRDQLYSQINTARGQNQVQQGGLQLNENQFDYGRLMDKYSAESAKAAGQQGAIFGALGTAAGAYFGKTPEAAAAGGRAGTSYGQAQGGLSTPYPSYYRNSGGGGGSGLQGL